MELNTTYLNERYKDEQSQKPDSPSLPVDKQVMCAVKGKLIDKNCDEEDWVAVIENQWIPQNIIKIIFPYPDDIEIGTEITLTIST